MTCYTYVLKCANGAYYTGSTKNLGKRFEEHQMGIGANFTKNNRPLKLVYFEELTMHFIENSK